MKERITVFEKSNELHERASISIPLASQTFSKSAMNFVKGASPLFLDSGDGCFVWDPDGNKYIDYISGLLPVILGYNDCDVNNAIIEQLGKGIIFSLPSRIECQLAEELVRLIPSAEMVRFGKSGSDVTTAAVRLARAFTGRNRVAVCGYHGWHDWYIGTTTRGRGVPDVVKDLTTSFRFNDLNLLESILKANPDDFAAVILEPEGIAEPESGYLESLRHLTQQYGVVLIFDEIISGFRASLGGAQQKHRVTPDLSTFGKSMANGMPLSAVVGRKEIMQLMEEVFVSGTFGGETLSIAASLATIKKLVHLDGPVVIEKNNKQLKRGINLVIDRCRLNNIVDLKGPDWWPYLSLTPPKGVDRNLLVSLLRQELVSAGILIGSTFNVSVSHCSNEVLKDTNNAFDEAFGKLSDYLTNTDPSKYLLGELVKPVFRVRS
jgi:glutamate-1-semialdehyde 2,1-aminomutase